MLAVGIPAAANAQPYTLRHSIPGNGSTGPAPNTIGQSVALQGDVAFVGAYQEQSPTGLEGRVYVYNKTNAGWAIVQTLLATSTHNDNYFGFSMDVDGDTLVVGAPSQNGPGFAYVFTRSGTTWALQAQLPSGLAVTSRFGWSVAVSGDTVVVGAPGATTAVAFTRSGTTWTRQGLPAPPNPTTLYGSSVDVSGTSICVGDPGDSYVGTFADRFGNTWIFTRSNGGWTLQQRIAGSVLNGGFGTGCAIEGDTAVIATTAGPIGSTTVGTVFVYARSGSDWTRQQQLVPGRTLGADERFGAKLALQGDVLVVGSPLDNIAVGAMDVFRRTGATWAHTQRTPSIDFRSSSFGQSVAVDGARLLVGSPEGGGGFVHVFETATSTVPGAPTNLQAVVAGNQLSLSWRAPTSGAAPTSYTLLARTAPGAAPIVTVPVGGGTTFAATAPNGTFILSLTATNAAGTGPESASQTVTFPGGAVSPPASPTGLGVSVVGTTATFSWTPPASGGAVAGYVLQAGTSPGFTAPVASLPLAASATSYAVPGVPPGSYHVRLVAQNAGGPSAPSNEVALTVGGTSAPGAPALSASVTGSTVTVSWTPGSGGAPTSYTLSASLTAGGPPVATVPVGGTSATFTGVGAGTYYLQLTASNGGGTSPQSNQVAVTVR